MPNLKLRVDLKLDLLYNFNLDSFSEDLITQNIPKLLFPSCAFAISVFIICVFPGRRRGLRLVLQFIPVHACTFHKLFCLDSHYVLY